MSGCIEKKPEAGEGWEDDDSALDDEIIAIEGGFNVTIPESKIGDNAQYVYYADAGLYSYDKNASKYFLIELDLDGTLRRTTPSMVTTEDGYGEYHNTAITRREMVSTLNIHVEGTDMRALDISGNMEGNMNEFFAPDIQKIVKNEMSGHIFIRPFASLSQDIEYDMTRRAYPDPISELLDNVDNTFIGRTLNMSSSGSLMIPYENIQMQFDWTVGASERVVLPSGESYDTLRVDMVPPSYISEFMPIMMKLWYADSIPVPVRRHYETNITWDEYKERGSIFLKEEMVLSSPFHHGHTSITLGDEVYNTARNSEGVYSSWKQLPVCDVDNLFYMDPEVMVNESIERIPELKKMMTEHPETYVTDMGYYLEKDWADPTGKTFSQNWTVTMGYPLNLTEDEYWDEELAIEDNVIVFDVVRTTYRDEDGDIRTADEYLFRGFTNNTEMLGKEEFSRDLLTFKGAMNIFALDEQTKEELLTSNNLPNYDENSRIYTNATRDIDLHNPLVNILYSVLGVSIPSGRYMITLHKSTFIMKGYTILSSIDAETGRMIQVSTIEGPALMELLLDWGT